MQLCSIEQFGKPDRAGLLRFLQYCQSIAVDREHAVLASISMPTEYLDPLAVLQSVNDPLAPHCYMERKSEYEGVAAAEPVLEIRTTGPGRFKACKDAAQDWLRHAVYVGDASLPWSGPVFFCAFAFEDTTPASAPLSSGYAFVPRWQVGWREHRFSATANLLVQEDADLEALVEPLWRAHERFVSFDFSSDGLEAEAVFSRPKAQVLDAEASGESYLRSVGEALKRIQSGSLSKVVLARSLQLRSETSLEPLEALDQLRQRFPDCSSFSFQTGTGVSWIGATPERLLKVEGGRFLTEALAGSAERGRGARQDALFSRKLLESAKDRVEHGLVLESICEDLRKLGLEPEFTREPQVLQLSNIQHLRVPLTGEMPQDLHVLDLASALHPTPALGGYPRELAMRCIAELEEMPRGLYGGLTGWFDGKGHGEMLVNIRCAEVQGNQAQLFAGAGIVAASDPQKELEETALKLISVLPCFVEWKQEENQDEA